VLLTVKRSSCPAALCPERIGPAIATAEATNPHAFEIDMLANHASISAPDRHASQCHQPGFGRRSQLQKKSTSVRQRLCPSPGLLAYTLRREEPGSLRRAVLERLYRNLPPADKRLCDAERHRTVQL